MLRKILRKINKTRKEKEGVKKNENNKERNEGNVS